MSPLSTARQFVHFADFSVDLQAGEVRKGGTRIKLQVQPFQVLQTLLERPGQTVTREELRKRIWAADTFVDFDHGLNNAVKKLREALRDDAEKPRFIETLAKRGYRFIGTVQNGSPTSVPDSASQPAAVPAAAPETTTLLSPRRDFLWGLGLGGALAVALVLVLGLNTGGLRDRLFGKSTTPRIQSLAVLPLQNLSNDPAQEYLSEGLTDALIADLGQTGSLRVVSRTSSMQYKGTKKSLPEIASELKVDGIIEGTVQRSGDRVRITAQLIDGRSDHHVWANSYERDFRDAFVLERDVTGDIAHQVQGRIMSANQSPLPQPQTTNTRALEDYLEGIYHENAYGRGSGEQELRKAAQYFQEATESDRNFAWAYIGMARALSELPVRSAEDRAMEKKATETALALDPKSAEALGIMAEIRWGDLDWSGAEQRYRQSIALNPNKGQVRQELCTLLAEMGRVEEAFHECEIAQELEPDKPHLPYVLYWRGEYDRSIAMLHMMAERHSDDGELHYVLFENLAQNKTYNDAIAELERAITLYGYSETAAKTRRAFARSGYEEALREFAKDFERLHASKQMFMPVNLADVYATIGDRNRAFFWLEKAYEHRDLIGTGEPLDYILIDPMLHPLRPDPRFRDLVRRMRPAS